LKVKTEPFFTLKAALFFLNSSQNRVSQKAPVASGSISLTSQRPPEQLWRLNSTLALC